MNPNALDLTLRSLPGFIFCDDGVAAPRDRPLGLIHSVLCVWPNAPSQSQVCRDTFKNNLVELPCGCTSVRLAATQDRTPGTQMFSGTSHPHCV